MSASKVRSDARLQQLSTEQRDKLASWLMDEALSYRKAAERAQKEFGVPFTTASMGTFWQNECVPRKLQRSSSAATSVKELGQLLNTDWDTANEQLLAQRVFEMMSDPKTDAMAVSFLAGALEKYKGRLFKEKEFEAKVAGSKQKFEQKDREIAQKEEALRLQHARFQRETCELFLKWQNDEKAKAITNSGASNAEKIEQLGQAMFGEDWTQ